MTAIAMVLMALGVSLSAVGGVVYQHGAGALYGSLDWVPHSGWMITNPGVAFAVGIAMITAAVACQARRFG